MNLKGSLSEIVKGEKVMFKKFSLALTMMTVITLNFGCATSHNNYDPCGTSVWFGKEVRTEGDMPKVGMIIRVHQIINIPETKEQTMVWQEFDGEVLFGDIKKVTVHEKTFLGIHQDTEKVKGLYIVYSNPREGISFFPYYR